MRSFSTEESHTLFFFYLNETTGYNLFCQDQLAFVYLYLKRGASSLWMLITHITETVKSCKFHSTVLG